MLKKALIAMLAALPLTAAAQNFQGKTVTIIVGYKAGRRL